MSNEEHPEDPTDVDQIEGSEPAVAQGAPSSTAIVVRCSPPPRGDYVSYRADLRIDFLYSCCYCSMTEVEAMGLGFQIDHYLPRKKYPQLLSTYSNLMWSCAPCNGRKGHYSFDATVMRDYCHVIRVDEESPSSHIEHDELRVKARTPKGEFNIQLLDLNRAPLIRLRELRRRRQLADELVAHGMRHLLTIALNRFPPDVRGRFEKQRQRLRTNAVAIREQIHSFIAEMSRSVLLDEDSDVPHRNASRREYLRTVGALGVPASTDSR